MLSYVILTEPSWTLTRLFLVLERFADPVWKVYDEQYERGEITLKDCLQKQFATVNASRQQIEKELNGAVNLRRGFKELANYCGRRGIPVVIASAGLDFVIDYLLRQWGLKNLLKRHGPKTTIVGNRIQFKFPKLLDRASVNFKDDLVRFHKKEGHKTIYIGDGFSDFPAARVADFALAIKESRLAGLLTKKRVKHSEVCDFNEVLAEIKFLSGVEH